jgi:plastocyanin
MGRLALIVATGAIASCHLADDPEPPKCPEGSHVELGTCVQDETEKIRVVLTAAATCPSIAPDTIKVKVGERFQFENKDGIVHTIKGTSDGQVWLTVQPGALSLGMSIARAGTWKYAVSDCGSTGTVVVE